MVDYKNLRCPNCGNTANKSFGSEVYQGKVVEKNMQCNACGLHWSINPTTLK